MELRDCLWIIGSDGKPGVSKRNKNVRNVSQLQPTNRTTEGGDTVNRNTIRIVKRSEGVRRVASKVHNPVSTVVDMERMVKFWVEEVRSKKETDSRLVFSKMFGSRAVG